MLFNTTKSNNLFQDNPSLMSDEYFSECTERELKYIFFLHDFDSPYSTASYQARQELSMDAAGFKRELDGKRWDKNARLVLKGGIKNRVQKAIDHFKFLLSKSSKERAVLAAIDEQLDSIIQTIHTTKPTVKEIKDYFTVIEKLPKILETRKQIMRILNLSEEEEQNKTTKQLSALDEFLNEES